MAENPLTAQPQGAPAPRTPLQQLERAIEMWDDQQKLSGDAYEQKYYPEAHPHMPMMLIKAAIAQLRAAPLAERRGQEHFIEDLANDLQNWTDGDGPPTSDFELGHDAAMKKAAGHIRSQMRRHFADLGAPPPESLLGPPSTDSLLCGDPAIGIGAKLMGAEGMTVDRNRCIFCGAILDMSTNAPTVCVSPKNTTKPDTSGDRHHVYHFVAPPDNSAEEESTSRALDVVERDFGPSPAPQSNPAPPPPPEHCPHNVVEKNRCTECGIAFVACEECSAVNGTEGMAVTYHAAPACALPGKEGSQPMQPECKSRNGRWWHGYCGENGFWVGREEAEGAMKAAAPPLVTAEQAREWLDHKGWSYQTVAAFASSLLAQQQARHEQEITARNTMYEGMLERADASTDAATVSLREAERRIKELEAGDVVRVLDLTKWIERAEKAEADAANLCRLLRELWNSTQQGFEITRETAQRIRQALAKTEAGS